MAKILLSRTITHNYLCLFKGGNNFVYISDPDALEKVMRQEGKYPRRETNLSPNMGWIMNKLDLTVSLPFKYMY